MIFFVRLGKRPRQTKTLSETDILLSSTLKQYYSNLQPFFDAFFLFVDLLYDHTSKGHILDDLFK